MTQIGWIGSTLLAWCGLPQVIKAIRDGHATGVSGVFLTMWLIGELCVLIYVLPSGDKPLIVNYTLNLVLAGILTFYKICPRVRK
jgi:uncharacterized protein with PQ loop repeat